MASLSSGVPPGGRFVGISVIIVTVILFKRFKATAEGKRKIDSWKMNAPVVGKVFRLKGKGFPEVNGYAKGDQLIHVNIWTPQHLGPEEKAALEKMSQSANFHPKPEKNEKGFFDKMREFFS